MTKNEALSELHALVDARLFSGRAWLTDKETGDAVERKITAMGLSEKAPGEVETSRTTALGKECQLDLMLVFLGRWCHWEIPLILEEYGLIDEAKFELICERLAANEDDPEAVLLPFIRAAYMEFFNPSRRLN